MVTYRGLRIYAMASKTVDVKILFPQYNCQPGRAEFDRFERNLLAHGGISDNEGTMKAGHWQTASCAPTMAQSMPWATRCAMPNVGVIPAAAGGNQGHSARTCRRKRLKESFSFIVKHIDNADMLRTLTEPGLGLLGETAHWHSTTTRLHQVEVPYGDHWLFLSHRRRRVGARIDTRLKDIKVLAGGG